VGEAGGSMSDRLWAPWRMAYILEASGKKPAGCIFCDLPAEGEDRRRENLILTCGERCFVIMNRYPYTNGHLLVVPRAHVAEPSLLDARDHGVLAELLRRSTRLLIQTLDAHGMNLGMNIGRVAGAGIEEHCHYHLVPRWNGDTNFMSAVADARVVSEGLLAGYDRLRGAFADLAPEVERELLGGGAG
jgi:ATP adenylyltransferase